MVSVSSQTLLYSRICFLLTIAFYMLKDSQVILKSSYVITLTQAMNLPIVDVEPYNPLFGVISLLFVASALQDIIPLFEKNARYFESIVLARTFCFFVLAIYSYFGSSYFLCNGLVFVYSFAEIWFNFVILNCLRDEAYENAKSVIEEMNLNPLDHEAASEVEMRNIMEDIIDQAKDL